MGGVTKRNANRNPSPNFFGQAATIISAVQLNGDNFIIPESRSDHFHVKVLDYLSKYKRGEVQDKFNWLEVLN